MTTWNYEQSCRGRPQIAIEIRPDRFPRTHTHNQTSNKVPHVIIDEEKFQIYARPAGVFSVVVSAGDFLWLENPETCLDTSNEYSG